MLLSLMCFLGLYKLSQST